MHVSLHLKGTIVGRPIVGREQSGNQVATFFVKTNVPGNNGSMYTAGFDVVVGDRLVEKVKDLPVDTPILLDATVKGATAFGTGNTVLANVDIRAFRAVVVAADEPDFVEVTIVGNVTRDAETEQMIDSGKYRTSFTLAHNYSFMKNGKREERAQYFDVYFSGDAPPSVGKGAKEGQALIVTGSLHAQGYTSQQDGRKRGRLKVNGFTWAFAGGKPKELTDEEKAERQARRHPNSPTGELNAISREEFGF